MEKNIITAFIRAFSRKCGNYRPACALPRYPISEMFCERCAFILEKNCTEHSQYKIYSSIKFVNTFVWSRGQKTVEENGETWGSFQLKQVKSDDWQNLMVHLSLYHSNTLQLNRCSFSYFVSVLLLLFVTNKKKMQKEVFKFWKLKHFKKKLSDKVKNFFDER